MLNDWCQLYTLPDIKTILIYIMLMFFCSPQCVCIPFLLAFWPLTSLNIPSLTASATLINCNIFLFFSFHVLTGVEYQKQKGIMITCWNKYQLLYYITCFSYLNRTVSLTWGRLAELYAKCPCCKQSICVWNCSSCVYRTVYLWLVHV